MPEHFDVIIVGAGLSGVGAAYHLQAKCPGKSFLILEGRDAIGGTWDLFRYPGIRSDSDMFTFGYSFRPWRTGASIADGPSILNYILETAQAYGIDRKIRFRHRVKAIAWSSSESLWTIDAERGDGQEPVRFTCNFLFTCTGYYDYAAGYTPDFPGAERFRGRIIHPQHWPSGFDYAHQRVVVIGSGATAVTLVPALAETAAHVTMLQRSPTYVVSLPSQDRLANWLRRHLSSGFAYGLVRWRNILFTVYFYNLCKRKPALVKRKIMGWVRDHLGAGYDVETHFAPRYNPWDQRLCLVPDADLFRAMNTGKAEVVTDQIKTFTEKGLALQSGRELEADVIVTATGLKLKLLGGMEVQVDGQPVNFAKTMNYKGAMFSNIPNMAAAIGYTNASWTLKCDLIADYVCRLLNYMDKHGYTQCVPRQRDPSIREEPLIDFTSGYIQRSIGELPRQGSKKPWRLRQNYLLDLISLRSSPAGDGALEFSGQQGLRRAA
jgi:cation diffusion facilitator CzcD-associated flavoprotein CzcO